MRSTESSPSSHLPPRLKDRFEELRAAYLARLECYRAQLVELRINLGSTGYSAAVYEKIHRVAHGMAGAAAVFETFDVARAARGLSVSALAAVQTPSIEADARVRRDLDALVDLLLTLAACPT